MKLTSAKLLFRLVSVAALVAIAPIGASSVKAEPHEADAQTGSVALVQTGISVAQAVPQTGAAQLERMGYLALQRFQSGNQLDGLRLAMEAGRTLSDRTQPGQPVSEYPALMPLLALQTILDQIHESHQIELAAPLDQVIPSPNGQVFATLMAGNPAVHIWDWSGQLRHQLPGQYGATFSGDGRAIAAITIHESQDSTIHVWNVETGDRLQALDVDGFVIRVALSPDGSQILTQRLESSTLEIWNAAGEQVGQVDHGSFIEQITFSPDGQWFATRSGDGKVAAWTAAGQAIARLDAGSMAFSPDGSRLAVATQAGAVQTVDRSGAVQTVVAQPGATVQTVTWSPTGNTLALTTNANRVELWRTTGEAVGQLPGTTVSFSPDGGWVVAVAQDGTISYQDPVSSSTFQLPGEYAAPRIFFSAASDRMLVVDRGQTVSVWNIAGKREVRAGAESFTVADLYKMNEFAIASNPSQTQAIQVSPDLSQVAAVRTNQKLSIWAVDNLYSDRARLPLPSDIADYYQISSMRFSADSQRVIVDDMLVWDTLNQELVGGAFAQAPNFTPDGRYLATPTETGTLVISNASTGQFVAEIQGQSGIFSPDGQRVISTEPNDTNFEVQTRVRVWDLTGQLLAEFDVPFNLAQFTFTPDGSGFAVNGLNSNQVVVWTPSQSEAIALDQGINGCCLGISHVAFSPDGQQVAVSVEGDPTVRVWQVTGPKIADLPGHQQVNQVIYSPDGQQILTADPRTGTIRIWSRTGQLLHQLTGSEQSWAIQFLPDGQTFLAIAHGGGTVGLWNLSGTRIASLVENAEAGNQVRVSADQRLIAIASPTQDTTALWTTTGRKIADLPGGTVIFSPDQEQLLTSSRNGTVRLWRTTGELVTSFSAHQTLVTALAFSPDGQRLATGSDTGEVRMWTNAGDLIGEWSTNVQTESSLGTSVLAIAFSPNGQRLVAGNGANQISVWQIEGLEGLLARGDRWLQPPNLAQPNSQ